MENQTFKGPLTVMRLLDSFVPIEVDLDECVHTIYMSERRLEELETSKGGQHVERDGEHVYFAGAHILLHNSDQQVVLTSNVTSTNLILQAEPEGSVRG